jgi:hypothetical protein
MDPTNFIATQILLVCSGRVIDRQLSEDLVADQDVLFLEYAGVLAKRVFSRVVAVLRTLVDEEQL